MDRDEHILESQLRAYCGSGIYPMHMPGHKRNLEPAPGLPYSWDVTEVPDTDDLHHADGILRDAMDRTARLWGSRRTWYLVNGSTCGILAAVYACVPAGGEIIAARNCHKSVFHAIELLNLMAHWLVPAYLPDWEICGAVSPASVSQSLREHPAARTVIITSPTYEGIVSDIASIAAVCHAAGARLIVDEAHGAHLGLFRTSAACSGTEPAAGAACDAACEENACGIFPDSALHLGADLVVQSAHKTLPSLTQTALLHLAQPAASAGKYDSAARSDASWRDAAVRQSGEEERKTEGSVQRAEPVQTGKVTRQEAEDEEKLCALERSIEHALDLFETSSPSYPLMASLDGCTGLLADRGRELFAEWERQILLTEETLSGLHNLQLLRQGGVTHSDAGCDVSGGIRPGEQSSAAGPGVDPAQNACKYDRSRFLLRARSGVDLTGADLSGLLRGSGIEPEMHCGRNVLLMSGCGDSAEGWERLRRALMQLDEALTESAESEEEVLRRPDAPMGCEEEQIRDEDPAGEAAPAESGESRRQVFSLRAPEMAMTPAAAQRRIQEGRTQKILLAEAAGRVSAEYVMAYPPGIPLLVPGERITAGEVQAICTLTLQGANMVCSLSGRGSLRNVDSNYIAIII